MSLMIYRTSLCSIAATALFLSSSAAMGAGAARGADPSGFWQCSLAKRSVYLAILPNGKLNLDGAAASYKISGKTLQVQEDGRWVTYPFAVKGKGSARKLRVTMPDKSTLACRAVGGSGERHLQGMLCSWSGGSSSYAGTSISRSTRVFFDGKGTLSYRHEGGFSGPAGLYHNRSGQQQGLYRVVSNLVYLVFPDGSAGVGRVHMRQSSGRITEVKYEGALYAAALCK